MKYWEAMQIISEHTDEVVILQVGTKSDTYYWKHYKNKESKGASTIKECLTKDYTSKFNYKQLIEDKALNGEEDCQVLFESEYKQLLVMEQL